MPKVIRTEVISQHHNDSPAGQFKINKNLELVTRKYNWNSLYQGVESYVKDMMFIWP